MVGTVRLTKWVLILVSILILVSTIFSSAFVHNAEASVSWGQEVTEVAKCYTGTKV
jgi:cytochrome oxidase Cu insertion factor (SCO1/SenC/PrrC family)